MSLRQDVLRNKFNELSDLFEQSYVGEVVSIDKLNEGNGAIKVRVYGVFDSIDLGQIPDEDLPDCYPLIPLSFGSDSGGGQFSSPKLGAKVRVVFCNDVYHPRYYGIEQLTPELVKLLKDDPEGLHSFVFDEDEDFKAYYTKKSGYVLDLKGSLINIRNEDHSVYIKNKDSNAEIELNGAQITILSKDSVDITANNTVTVNASTVHVNSPDTKLGNRPIYKAVNGEVLMLCLKALATIVDAKLPIATAAISLVQQMEQQILSDTVTTTP